MSFRKNLAALVTSTAIGLGVATAGTARASSVTYDSANSPIQKQSEEMPEWEFVARTNASRTGSAAASDNNGFIYAIGGGGNSSVERYAPSTNTWEFVAPMNEGRDRFSAINVNGKIYAVSGQNSTRNQLTDTMEIYNPNSNTWTLSPYELNIPRTGFGLAKDNEDNIYAIGGAISIQGTPTNSVEVFDTNNPSLGWQLFTPLNSSLEALVSGTDELGRVYAIGGGNKSVVRFDPASPELGWQTAPSIHLGGGVGASATAFDGTIFIMEGLSSVGVESYDNDSDSWSIHSHLGASAQYASAAHDDINGYLYKMAGHASFGGDGTNVERVYTGIIIPEPSQQCPSNLVHNGGFTNNADGWTLINHSATNWQPGPGWDGKPGYFLINSDGGVIETSQLISGLIPGRNYEVSGYFKKEDNPQNSSFRALLDDNIFFEGIGTRENWERFQFNYLANDNDVLLRFQSQIDADVAHLIDNICFTPEPPSLALAGAGLIALSARRKLKQ